MSKNKVRTKDLLLKLLKEQGPVSAQDAAQELGMTSMGARQPLELLIEEGLVEYLDVKTPGKGRPKRLFCLTDTGHRQFGDQHSRLTLELIEHVQVLFGDEGLEKVIAEREKHAEQQYLKALENKQGWQDILNTLATIRTEEGYMAEALIEPKGGYLVEQHCPICDAARHCQGFCRSELSLFQTCFADVANVERTEHMMDNAQRCCYKITPLND